MSGSRVFNLCQQLKAKTKSASTEASVNLRMELLETSLTYIVLLIAFAGFVLVALGHGNFYLALKEVRGFSSKAFVTIFPPLMFFSSLYNEEGSENLRSALKWWLRGVGLFLVAFMFRALIQYGFHGEL